MSEFVKPRVVVSKCIEFDYCRWNGNIINSPIVNIMKNYIDFTPICAEFEIGLGVPRYPVRIELNNNQLSMIQPKTNMDVTDKMNQFAHKFLDSLEEIDGFILKSDSPSCGVNNVKHYVKSNKNQVIVKERGSGLFAKAILERFPNYAVETEGRLRNFRIREHFLTKLYTIAAFREIKKQISIHKLIEFHTKNKYLFMAYNQTEMRKMGRFIANQKDYPFKDVLSEYKKSLELLLTYPPIFTSNINVLMHMLGYFSKALSKEEKAFFLDELEKYRTGWIPLFVCTNLIKLWIRKFNEPYLRNQSFLDPFPQELMNFDLKDTWRGRDYWNQPEKR
ncbi:MAG: YbgA family protein [Candidatus Thorarchaeota archaeon]